MCLAIKDIKYGGKREAKAKIAQEDLIVLKVMTTTGKRGVYESQYRNFKYEKGFHYINDNFPMRTIRKIMGGEGLHSFSLDSYEAVDAIHYAIIVDEGRIGKDIAIECIIPKGTPYYVGCSKDLISRELIIVGQPTKTRAKKLELLASSITY